MIKKFGYFLATFLWAGVVVCGGFIAAKYELAPSVQADAIAQWPEAAAFEPSNVMHTLVMFIHPKCPCTRASVGELTRLVTRFPGIFKLQVAVLVPDAADAAWMKTDIVTAVRRIPNVEIFADLEGAEARRFGTRSSGEVLLYAPTGALRYQGGLTQSRGHHGDNLARDTVERLLLDDQAPALRLPVFGCGLFAEATPESN